MLLNICTATRWPYILQLLCIAGCLPGLEVGLVHSNGGVLQVSLVQLVRRLDLLHAGEQLLHVIQGVIGLLLSNTGLTGDLWEGVTVWSCAAMMAGSAHNKSEYFQFHSKPMSESIK